MRRRDMIKGVFASMLGLSVVTKTEADKKEIVETRTRTYLDNIPLWDEHIVLFDGKDEQHKEFLFTEEV